jgi:hypothetical protein
VTARAVARSSLGTSLARYSRSWGLWLLLLVAPVGARFWIPDENDRTVVISVNDHAPVMTSAMLGVTLGIVITTLLLPVAFIYLRSNATRRQPWQVEEVTAGSRVAVALGRFAADCAMLAAVLAAMTLAGWFIAWLVTPLASINLAQITLGLWLIAAPSLMGVAAIRILFDSFPATRGPLGEVLYFVIWMASIITPLGGAERNASFAGNMTDFAGFVRPLTYDLPPGQEDNFTIGAGEASAPGRIELDVMSGLLSEGYVASRFAWAAIAIALAALAGLAYRPHRPRKERRRDGPLARLLAPGAPPAAQPDAPPAGPARLPLPGLVWTEARLIAEGRLWLLLAALIAAAGVFVDYRLVASPAALLLLIFGLTAHAGRSEQPGLLALTRTAPLSPWVRRLAFVAAGLAWSLLLALPAAIAHGTGPLLLALATGAAVPAAAILLGAWTRSAFAPRLVLLIAWYLYLSAA